jgi:urease accessory protein UreE
MRLERGILLRKINNPGDLYLALGGQIDWEDCLDLFKDVKGTYVVAGGDVVEVNVDHEEVVPVAYDVGNRWYVDHIPVFVGEDGERYLPEDKLDEIM